VGILISDLAPVKSVREIRKKRFAANLKRLIKCCRCASCQPGAGNDVDVMEANK